MERKDQVAALRCCGRRRNWTQEEIEEALITLSLLTTLEKHDECPF